MMKPFGIVAAGAGLGFLLLTDTGRRWMRTAGDAMSTAYDRISDSVCHRDSVDRIVRDVVRHQPPDTAVAQAFEEALPAT